jgi:hypothetical protein
MEIKITKEKLALMGSNSLLGLIGKGNDPSIKILFEQTSMRWREKHHGAEEIILPEYVPMCLMSDLLWLVQNGFEVEIDEYSEEVK